MDTIYHSARSWLTRLAILPALVLGFATAAQAQPLPQPQAQSQEIDPPGRVATLTQQQGSVVFAPEGENEWTELPVNRPLTRGDRVWTDRSARAELHMGATTLHLDSQAHLAFFELDDESTQLSLTQGSVNVRVRDLQARENFEVDTPNLAVRAARAGDYRVDVDPADGTTRVLVRSGEAIVYGQGGESVRLQAGQQATFDGRDLRQVRGNVAGTDAFDQWAADLNRREDQSVSARYIPRQVIGYQELDNHGSWSTHESYGPVWYPRVVASDWAPYRHGRWSYIRPWGWTWIDEAPWGFAPFHYGRWAVIGSRWAWVPGSFGPRPVYSPALVAFVGGGSGVSISLNFGSGPGIGWYPLGPGEAWYPTYRTSNVYITNVNRYFTINRDPRYVHMHRNRSDAWTSVRVEDFNRGRRVQDNWRPVRPNDFANAQVTTQLPRPDREDRGRDRGTARLVAPPPAVTPNVPSRNFTGINREERRDERRDAREERRDDRRDAREERKDDRREAREERREDRRDERASRNELPRTPAAREETRGDDARRQVFERQREEQQQREQQARQQRERQEQAREQREQATRQQERAQREQAARQQHQQERAEREQAMRQQQAERQQERAQREQAQRQQHEQRAQQREQARQQQEQQRAQRAVREAEAAPPPRRERPQRDDDDEQRKGRGRNG